MNQDTLLALKDSISHWERMIACENPYDSAERPEGAHCPLCERFRRFDCTIPRRTKGGGEASVEKCPVARRAGRTGCSGTPYLEAFLSYTRWVRACATDDPRLADHEVEQARSERAAAAVERARSEWVAAAVEELEFLKSLLPENGQSTDSTDCPFSGQSVESVRNTGAITDQIPIMVCVDCSQYIATGEIPDSEEWDQGCADGFLDANEVVPGDSENNEEFSRSFCDCCESGLAGERHEFVILIRRKTHYQGGD